MLRRRSPDASTLRWLPVTNSATPTLCSLPSAFQIVQTPSSAAARAIIGPAGSDMQRLPPTVALFQILKEAWKARQHWLIRGAASQSVGQGSASSCATVQVAAIESPPSVTVSAGHLKSARSISLVRCVCGSLYSQVPPASHASPAVQLGSCSRDCGRAISVMVFRSMGYRHSKRVHRPVGDPARPKPVPATLGWSLNCRAGVASHDDGFGISKKVG